MLKNLMEDKQLNFNQPLLSVRRFSSTSNTSEADDRKNVDKPTSQAQLPPLPFYKSDLKSGPIRNPGTVPFVWEQIPGRPKDERISRPKATVPPKLPPGRASKIEQQVSETEDNICASEDKCSSGSDADEAYMDARETLSRSDSLSMNGSVSGLDSSNAMSSGTFLPDPQTRDLMMGRFLPAAKAMASETPHYALKKQPVVREQQRQVNNAVNLNKRAPIYQSRPNGLPPYAQELVHEESDCDSEMYDGSDIMTAKVCGLFPRFLLRNSLCLLNPVPGMKMPVSSARSCNETKLEHFENVRRNPRQNGFDINKGRRKIVRDLLVDESKCEAKTRSPVAEKTLYVDSVHTIKSPSSDSSFLDMRSFTDPTEKSSDLVDTHSLDSSLRADEKSTVRPKSIESVDSCSPFDSGRSTYEKKTGVKNGSWQEDSLLEKFDSESRCSEKSFHPEKSLDFTKDSVIVKNLVTQESSKTADHKKINFETQQTVKTGTEKSSNNGMIDLESQRLEKLTDREECDISYLQMALALPSPKSPSESWLKRALPVVSSRNSRSSLAARIGATCHTGSPLDPKWESIVKSSNVQHGRLRFTEELLSPIPES